MVAKYAIGVDFGTESGRAIVVDVRDGTQLASAVYTYVNGVIDERLPYPDDGVVLPPDWALQDPDDYLRVLQVAVPAAIAQAGVRPTDVIGIGIDFTSCTMLPALADGTALAQTKAFRSDPHAWVKLWKHHAAQPEADRINAVARATGQAWLDRYGGKISSEWFFSKALQILDEAPAIYAAADRLIEAADWVVWRMTGVETRNACTAGYKAMWSKRDGFPDPSYFGAPGSGLRIRRATTRCAPMSTPPVRGPADYPRRPPPGPGCRQERLWRWPTSMPTSPFPPRPSPSPARMVMIMGTSTCHMVLGPDERIVPGMCGCVEDGIIPGFFGYEAGQSCVGDHFAWFVEQGLPAAYLDGGPGDAAVDIHALLQEQAARLRVGESGLLALDWWNGNRSVLVDADLNGLLVGMTLATTPEEIYRALIEATAYGTRVIIETFEANGVPIHDVVACGGLADKSPLIMQIYADVTGLPVQRQRVGPDAGPGRRPCSGRSRRRGRRRSRHDRGRRRVRWPASRTRCTARTPRTTTTYDLLYREYLRLHDYFGRGENDVMKRPARLARRGQGGRPIAVGA